jgi:hypothetical protein
LVSDLSSSDSARESLCWSEEISWSRSRRDCLYYTYVRDMSEREKEGRGGEERRTEKREKERGGHTVLFSDSAVSARVSAASIFWPRRVNLCGISIVVGGRKGMERW